MKGKGRDSTMKSKGGFWRLMRRWKADDFFRQLATVVIGIIITFGGNSLIQRNAQRKEARHLLEMVREELCNNAFRVRKQAEWFGYLNSGAVALTPYLDDPRAVPTDTLLKYGNIPNSLVYSSSTDAFDILKSSPAIQSIRDKRFVLDLFSTYDQMSSSAHNAQNYSDTKLENWQRYYESVERDMIETVFRPTDPVATFAHASRSPDIARYIVEAATEDWLDTLIDQHEAVATAIDNMVAKIDEKIN